MQDKVLKSIFDWVENHDNQHPYSWVSSDEIDKLSVTTRENGQNNRNSCKEYTKLEDKSSLLSRLLEALKINSVSIECLEEMSRHHLCTRSSVKCVSPRETSVLPSEIKFPDMMRNPESALDFDKSILIFCSTDSDERSTVFSLDVPDHKWTDCGHLEGSATNLFGFKNKTNYFILQRDGTVSQVLRNQADDIEFTMIKRLWSIQSALRGAFIYSDMLYIFSNTPMETSCLCGVSGVFSRIEYWHQEQEACDFVQFFMPRLDICQSESIYDSEYDYDDESDN
ncbi:kelch protein 8 [Biomphalaria glabrata]|nr:kelch protein 8 [Biomphalaria glabrata]